MTNALATTDNVPTIKTKDKNVDEDCVAFGRRLEKAMQDAEITQAELSRLMGMSRSGVNWWIQGLTYPSVEKAKRLANLLRVTPEYLIYGVINHSKDRMMESIPVYDTRINGTQQNVSQLGLPKDFIARNLPHSNGTLKGVSVESADKSTTITIADTSDREITEEPKTMLIDFGSSVKAVSVMKDKKSILIEMPGSGLVTMTEGDFRKGNLVLGHVFAELHAGRA